MESFFNTPDKQNSWRRAVSLLRKKSDELIQVPVVDLNQLKNSNKSKFTKWETTVDREHLPEIEKLIFLENSKMLQHLQKMSEKPSLKTKWKAIARKSRYNPNVEKESTAAEPKCQCDEKVKPKWTTIVRQKSCQKYQSIKRNLSVDIKTPSQSSCESNNQTSSKWNQENDQNISTRTTSQISNGSVRNTEKNLIHKKRNASIDSINYARSGWNQDGKLNRTSALVVTPMPESKMAAVRRAQSSDKHSEYQDNFIRKISDRNSKNNM